MSFAVLGPPCAKKIRKEDPFDIFVFDLTSSSDEESCHDQNSNITSPNIAPKHPVKRYGTRSKKFQQINTQTFAESEKIKTRQRRANKSVSVTADPSVLRKKAISTSNFKDASSTDDKTCGYKKTSPSTNTPNRPVKASIEDGIPRSKVAQNVFQVKCYRIRSHNAKFLSALAILPTEPFLTLHTLCTGKNLCTKRVKYLLSMLRYSF